MLERLFETFWQTEVDTEYRNPRFKEYIKRNEYVVFIYKQRSNDQF